MNIGKQLGATFTEEELERIEKICEREFLKQPAFIRHAVLKRVREIEERENSG